MGKDKFLHDTREALGEEILKKFRDSSFCIAGCGAVGSLFAEMLVRTGARKVSLIDGDHVERANLNRTTAFVECDVGKPKVEVLKNRLQSIVPDKDCLTIRTRPDHLREDDEEGHALVKSSDFTIIAMDTNWVRLLCEKTCWENRRRYVSIGIEINPNGEARYQCAWRPKTDPKAKDREGYGHGSYASIVMEATAVGFGMLLSHIKDPDCTNNLIERRYENFIPLSC